jgi:hypothetical protein
MDKVTYKAFVEAALSGKDLSGEDMQTTGKRLLAMLDKRNSGERKPTATDKANDALIEEIITAMSGQGKFTPKEARENITALAGMSPQKVLGVLNRGVKQGKIVAYQDDKKHMTYEVEGE